MRLDFNVLWVEDQPERVKAQGRKIAAKMEAEGFAFNPTFCHSLAEVKDVIASDVFTDEIDLVLVDWDLGDGEVGQDAIAAIRDNVRYKDVVFYSGQKTSEELRQLVFQAALEGVFCTTREDLVAEVIGVFESLVKKVLDLDHMRGIVMGASSDIDNIVIECLTVIHSQLDDDGKRKMLGGLLRRIKTRMKDLVKRAKKLEAADSIDVFFQEHMLFTANDRLRVLSESLEAPSLKKLAGSREAVTSYMDQVVPKRNVLGHQVLFPEGKPKAFRVSKGKAMSFQSVRDLRRLILTLRGEFRKLLEAIRK